MSNSKSIINSRHLRVFTIGAVANALLCLCIIDRANGQTASDSAGELKIVLAEPSDAAAARVHVTGLPARVLSALQAADLDPSAWSRIFALRIGNAGTAGGDSSLPPVLGTYEIDRDKLVFTPQFPLRPGLSYHAVFDPTALAAVLSRGSIEAIANLPNERLTADLALPAPPPDPPTTVTAVYPSANELPENQLKFYIHFSAPMSRGESYQNIRLVTSSGEAVAAPFLELGQELWDGSGQRFTLFFEPGRVKQGLRPRADMGPPLVAGGAYTLVIERDWRDARGKPLRESFRKDFRVMSADHTQPDPNKWQLAAPPAGTRQPLIVDFQEPLDHAMLQRVIGVESPAGDFAAGRIEIGRNETQWSFTPAEPWQVGRYELAIEGTLEDLAGNSIGRLFEVDLTGEQSETLKEARVAFEVAE